MLDKLRRRLMGSGKKVRTIEVKESNSNGFTSNYPPIINGVASRTGVYQVEDGGIITLRGYNRGEYGVDLIFVNGVSVVNSTNGYSEVDYPYTVRSNCVIETTKLSYGYQHEVTRLTTK